MTENIAIEIKIVSGAIESASVEIRRNEKSGTWAMRLDGVEIGEPVQELFPSDVVGHGRVEPVEHPTELVTPVLENEAGQRCLVCWD